MHEILVIIPRRKKSGGKVLNMVWFVLACLMIILAMGSPLFFTIPAVVFGLLWYYQTYQSEIEFEYTYYDGDLRFAKIRAKSRRKSIAMLEMDDVMIIAPRGDRSVTKYENDRGIPCKDLTSGRPDAKVYELVCKGEKGLLRYEFEPDEDMLNAITVKYPRSVVR